MLIKPIVKDPKKSLNIGLHKSTVDKINRYKDYYESQCDEIERSDLIEQMILAVLDKDKEFKKWAKNNQSEGQAQMEKIGALEDDSNVENIRVVNDQ